MKVFIRFFLLLIFLSGATHAKTGDLHTIQISRESPQFGASTRTRFKKEGKILRLYARPQPGLIASISVDGQFVSRGEENTWLIYNLVVSADHQISITYLSVADQYFIGGEISGLQGSITLSNNAELLTLTTDGPFTFPTQLETGHHYSVQIVQMPDNLTCQLSNGTGQVADKDITNIVVSCTTITNQMVSISGTLTAAPLIQVDSDINDPLAKTNISNDSFSEAQELENFFTVNGFASDVGTGRILRGDRFGSLGDKTDVYHINLQKDQTITMQVVDFAGTDVFQGDLDLFVYDSNFDLVAWSIQVGEFETVVVPEDGDYYVTVNAFQGISKYTLQFGSLTDSSYKATRQSDFVVNEAIIKFKPNLNGQKTPTQSNQNLRLNHRQTQRPALAKLLLAKHSLFKAVKQELVFLQELKQKNRRSFDKFNTLWQIKELNQQADVDYAEPNYLYQLMRAPSDEFYSFQWHYPLIDLPQAWDITTGKASDRDIIVAVIDTGVFLDHPDLAGQLIEGYDFISNSNNAKDGDGIDSNADDPGDGRQIGTSSWHGTHVAGTIAARSNNTTGVTGIAWNAKIMPLRVLGQRGGSLYDIGQAVRYAAGLSNDSGLLPDQKADIINLSLGGPGFSQSSQDDYNAAKAQGVLVFAAAGNDNTSQLSYPASYDNVFSVSAVDLNRNKAPYSNFGVQVDLAAPGGDTSQDRNRDGYADGILSTLVDDSTGVRQPVYMFYQGTSMASPHAAGIAALMRAVNPDLTVDEFENLLVSGLLTDEAGDTGRDNIFGYGIINASKAVQAALALGEGGNLPELPALITATPSSLNFELTSNTARLFISNEGGQTVGIESITSPADWLIIEANNVDSNTGLGEYTVIVDRTGLNDSTYSAALNFNLTTGEKLVVQVSMIVGEIDNTGDMGNVFVLLIDADSQEVIDQVLPSTTAERNVFNYRFDQVSTGRYTIFGGSDIDNDLLICQLGESCGAYPVLSNPSEITVDSQAVDGVDFVVDILSTINSSVGQTLSESQHRTIGIRRISDSN